MAARNAAGRCPSCDALPPKGATVCPVCGAALPAAVDDLVEGLDDLGSEVEAGGLVEELETLTQVTTAETRAVDQTLGELAAAEEAVAALEERIVEEEADLSAFVARVEESIAAKARRPRAPPRPSPFVGPALAVSGIVAAVGLFLLPTSVPIALSVLMVAVALAGAGVAIRRAPVRQ